MTHRRPRILVIDDEPGIRMTIDLLLHQECEVTTITYPCTPPIWEERAFDLIFLDLRLPGVQGYELLTTLRRRLPATPIVILSASTDAQVRTESLAHGATGVLEKPFSRQELLDGIWDTLNAKDTE